MSPRPFLFGVAAAAVALGATAATVQPAHAAAIVAVSYQDLNLASDAGRAALDARIERAASEVCGTAQRGELRIASEVAACRQAALAGAQRQRDALLGLGRPTVEILHDAS